MNGNDIYGNGHMGTLQSEQTPVKTLPSRNIASGQ